MQDLTISVFERDSKPIAGAVRSGAWSALVQHLSEPAPAYVEKKDLPLWSPACFRDAHRRRESVEVVYAIAFDVDVAPVPSADALRAALAGRLAAVHSSSSATATAPRWRLVLALSRPVTADEYDRLWPVVAGDLPFPVGAQSKDPSRAWYLPRRGADGFFEAFAIEGDPIDVEAALSRAPAAPTAPATAAGELPRAPETPRVERTRLKRAAAAMMLGNAWPETGRHAAQLALAGAMKRDGWTPEDALEMLCAVCRAAGNEDRPKREQTIAATWRAGENVTGWTALEAHVDPMIVASVRELLNPHADDFAAVARDLGWNAPAAAVAPSSGLGFEFGAWKDEPPPVAFLVEGLIPRGAVAMFFGRADSLKTWLLFSLAVALANGAPWLGFSTRKAKVGIVDIETGKSNVGRRLYMLGAGASPNLGAKSFPTLKPNDERFWTELAREGFDAVIVDSLRKANPGANENDSAEAIVPLELAAEFSERTGCAVLWIDHARKESGDGWPEFRGSAAIEDQVDCAFAVKKQDVSAALRRVEIRCEKPGDMKKPDPFSAEIEFDDVQRRANVRLVGPEAPTTWREEDMGEQEIRAAIKLALANGPIETKEKLRERVRGNRQRVYAEASASFAGRRSSDLDVPGFLIARR